MGLLNKYHELIRRIVRLIVLVVVLVYFPITMSYVNAEKRDVVCQKIEGRVDNSSDNILIGQRGLETIVRDAFPAIEGTLIREMNLHEMERTIEQQPVVQRCEMFTTVEGTLHVRIEQREPIMRVFTPTASYYMDANAFRINAQRDMHARVVVVNGNVGAILDSQELIDLAKYINDNKFWRAQIEQIYVTNSLEYILIPRVGDHIIEFGNAERLREKFDLLYALYTKGWDKREWNNYKKVSVKYKGQIVCTKR